MAEEPAELILVGYNGEIFNRQPMAIDMIRDITDAAQVKPFIITCANRSFFVDGQHADLFVSRGRLIAVEPGETKPEIVNLIRDLQNRNSSPE